MAKVKSVEKPRTISPYTVDELIEELVYFANKGQGDLPIYVANKAVLTFKDSSKRITLVTE